MPCPRSKVPITEAGWYYLQVAFLREACGLNYPTGTQCVVAQMGLFKAFPGGSCGSLVASWKVLPRPEVLPGFGVVSVSDRVENYGGPRCVYEPRLVLAMLIACVQRTAAAGP